PQTSLPSAETFPAGRRDHPRRPLRPSLPATEIIPAVRQGRSQSATTDTPVRAENRCHPQTSPSATETLPAAETIPAARQGKCRPRPRPRRRREELSDEPVWLQLAANARRRAPVGLAGKLWPPVDRDRDRATGMDPENHHVHLQQ
ncbi:elongation factor 2, partial [Striga asiatica]